MKLTYLGVACLAAVTVSLATTILLSEPSGTRAQAAAARVSPQLKRDLQAAKLVWGAPIFLRIFKRERVLQLWIARSDGVFQHFRDYPICAYSGELGPKTREGDRQAPEGIYQVSLAQLNPASRFHLSFNLGYPNRFDRAHGYTGSALMVHGNCGSIGCYAMTDAKIEEIYTLAETALRAGQAHIAVHAFPFELGEAALAEQSAHRWFPFWRDLQPIYSAFESSKRVPKVAVDDMRYRVTP